MSLQQGILLTGSTGLLGRYLLRDLLASGDSVTVLIRPSPAEKAAERLHRLLAFAEDSLRRKLPLPTLLVGDLSAADLGLCPVERRWLARNVSAVLHSAACVSHQPTANGEPWETNVHGTRRLLELCRSVGLTEFHHLSTAFLCGDRRGLVREDELDCGRGSGNAYEQSKFAAEQIVRGFRDIRATIYRPSVIVGDSRTGYTSTYHHFYRFLELAVRLSAPSPQPLSPWGRGVGVRETKLQRERLSLRLPLAGTERQNFVPVDWVSRAILELLHRPQWHGHTFHLAARQPIRLQELANMIGDLLQFEAIQCVGCEGLTNPTAVEQLIQEQFQDYWSYLGNDLDFDCRNTRQALPDLPPPSFDRALLVRLLQFAQENGWGRERTEITPQELDIGHYLQHLLPAQVRQSRMAHVLPHNLAFALDIRGPGGGMWSYRWAGGTLRVQRGRSSDAIATYRMDSSCLADLLRGRIAPQQAFFDGRIEIDGDEEKALQLAHISEHFFAESSAYFNREREAVHAGVGA